MSLTIKQIKNKHRKVYWSGLISKVFAILGFLSGAFAVAFGMPNLWLVSGCMVMCSAILVVTVIGDRRFWKRMLEHANILQQLNREHAELEEAIRRLREKL